MLKEKKLNYIGGGAILATTIIWGSSFFILKNAIDELPTFFVLALRFLIAAVVVFIIFFKNLIKIDKKTLVRGLILGLILSCGYILQTLGLETTTPAKNAFLTAAYCIMVPFFGWAMFKKKPTIFNILAAIISVVGIGLISLEGSFRMAQGDYLTLASAIFYALQILFIATFVKKSDFKQLLFLELLTVGIICLVISLFAEPIPQKVNVTQWLSLIYLGVVASCVAQLLQIFGQKYTPANNVSIILSLEAVFGAIFSIIFYKERPSMQMIGGFIVMFFAIIVSEVGYDLAKRIKKKMKKKGE